jgi:cytochrome d ubiquinol oxidase subunit I
MARAEITDFWAMVFNPSAMHRLIHVLLGAYLQAAFFVMSIAAFYLLKNRHLDFARKSFTIALVTAVIAGLAILVSGDLQAKKVAITQPAKLAAMEGHFETGPAALYLFGVPDADSRQVRYAIAWPGLLSFLVHGSFRQPVTGLDQFVRQDWPPVGLTFFSYHLMLWLGAIIIGLALVGAVYRWRGTVFQKRWLLWAFVWAVPLPYLANQAGWVAAEVGRQPWVVYGLLRTSDALSKAVKAEQVLFSIVMFTLIYALLLAVFLFILDSKIKQGPDEPTMPPQKTSAAELLRLLGKRAGQGGDSLTQAGG